MSSNREDQILHLAVRRGLLSSATVDELHALTVNQERTVQWGPRIDHLVEAGHLDRDAVEQLAREVDLDEQPTAAAIPCAATPTSATPAETPARPQQGSVVTGEELRQGADAGRLVTGQERFDLAGWDRYRIEERIGKGGMGVVYRAYDPRLKRSVALKFISGDTDASAQRFIREAQAQARIEHPNVCKIYEVGEVEGRLYIAMQLIDGEPLNRAAKEMSLEQKVKVIEQVAEAIHAAHRTGLIHRDLKPSNIMVERTEDGQLRPYVLDFGLAKEVAAEGLTATGLMVGTPAYLAPEQLRSSGSQVDRRSDVYSLGATLYELAVGTPPFVARNTIELIMKAVSDEPRSPRAAVPSVPVDLETIILKCLVKEPQHRYDSARALADDLGRFLDGEPIAARREPLYRLGKWIRRHRVAVSLIALVLAAVASVSITWLHERWRAAKQAEVAQDFGQQVRDVAWLLRVAHTIPRHDISAEKAEVRERMGLIEQRMKETGSAALGPGNYALGRAHLDLGETTRALHRLQTAWDSGYRLADVAFSLGHALADTYQVVLMDINTISDAEQRRVRREQAQRRFQQPAVEMLNRGKTSRIADPSYISGLVALNSGDLEAAAEHAATAFENQPRLYEAKLLESMAHRTAASEKADRGEYDDAMAQLERADAALFDAARIGESDPLVFEIRCTVWNLALDMLLHGPGGELESVHQRALDACIAASEIDPNKASIWYETAKVWQLWAQHLIQRGDDPVDALEQTERAAGRAIELAPQWAVAHLQHGNAQWARAEYQRKRGEGSPETVEAAIASFERGRELDPSEPRFDNNLGIAYDVRGQIELGRDEDPRPWYQKAIACYQNAAAKQPNNLAAVTNMGVAWTLTAEYEIGHDIDPRPAVRQAAEAFETALAINPDYPVAHNALGSAHHLAAEYEADHDLDPHASFEAAAKSLQRAVEINPEYTYAQNNLAMVLSGLGHYLMHHGGDPRQVLRDSIRAAEQSLEHGPNQLQPHLILGETHSFLAQALAAAGNDPSDHMASSFKHFDLVIKALPHLDLPYYYRLAATATGVRIDLAAGARGEPPMRRAAPIVNVARRSGADLNPFASELIALHILQARWLLVSGTSPAPAITDLESLYARIREQDGEFEPPASVRADLDLMRAHWARRSGQPAAELVARGLERLEPLLAEDEPAPYVRAIHAGLLVERARAEDDPVALLETATNAVTGLETVFTHIPHLGLELGWILDEAREAAGEP